MGEREDDGRWLAVAPALPGVLVYGDTEAEARAHAASLALRVISIPLRFGRKSSRPRSAADNPVCLLVLLSHIPEPQSHFADSPSVSV